MATTPSQLSERADEILSKQAEVENEIDDRASGFPDRVRQRIKSKAYSRFFGYLRPLREEANARSFLADLRAQPQTQPLEPYVVILTAVREAGLRSIVGFPRPRMWQEVKSVRSRRPIHNRYHTYYEGGLDNLGHVRDGRGLGRWSCGGEGDRLEAFLPGGTSEWPCAGPISGFAQKTEGGGPIRAAWVPPDEMYTAFAAYINYRWSVVKERLMEDYGYEEWQVHVQPPRVVATLSAMDFGVPGGHEWTEYEQRTERAREFLRSKRAMKKSDLENESDKNRYERISGSLGMRTYLSFLEKHGHKLKDILEIYEKHPYFRSSHSLLVLSRGYEMGLLSQILRERLEIDL